MPEFTVPTHLPRWIQDHVRQYLDSDGKQGHMMDLSAAGGAGEVATLLLITKGRKSGKYFTAPLVYGEVDGNCIIVGSLGGAAKHPNWYPNLVAEPEVRVKVGTEDFYATARTAEGAEREKLWQHMAVVFPTYNDYQKKTERQIPVIVLEKQTS
ncbi:MAG: nitroreductase family deazaflavin-dependent oxidoreductase [Pseudomonadales bacterium]|nr:nitroreductase family deazaflavin-dependent oxidoreductase [Pseudomonadales bacterium]